VWGLSFVSLIRCFLLYTLLCRYLISQRPEVEARIVAELGEAGLLATPENPTPRAFELNDMQNLPYLLCVCKVTMVFPFRIIPSLRVVTVSNVLGENATSRMWYLTLQGVYAFRSEKIHTPHSAFN